MKKGLLVAGGALLILLVALAYMGLFRAVVVEERDMGPYRFVYVQDPSSDFSKVGELTEALGQRLEAAGIVQRQPAQIYYARGRGLQNQIGFVVDQPVGQQVLGPETFYRAVPAQRCMVASFPFRNPLSFLLGYLRVDPVLRKYREAQGYQETSAMVILQGESILYLQPTG